MATSTNTGDTTAYLLYWYFASVGSGANRTEQLWLQHGLINDKTASLTDELRALTLSPLVHHCATGDIAAGMDLENDLHIAYSYAVEADEGMEQITHDIVEYIYQSDGVWQEAERIYFQPDGMTYELPPFLDMKMDAAGNPHVAILQNWTENLEVDGRFYQVLYWNESMAFAEPVTGRQSGSVQFPHTFSLAIDPVGNYAIAYYEGFSQKIHLLENNVLTWVSPVCYRSALIDYGSDGLYLAWKRAGEVFISHRNSGGIWSDVKLPASSGARLHDLCVVKSSIIPYVVLSEPVGEKFDVYEYGLNEHKEEIAVGTSFGEDGRATLVASGKAGTRYLTMLNTVKRRKNFSFSGDLPEVSIPDVKWQSFN